MMVHEIYLRFLLLLAVAASLVAGQSSLEDSVTTVTDHTRTLTVTKTVTLTQSHKSSSSSSSHATLSTSRASPTTTASQPTLSPFQPTSQVTIYTYTQGNATIVTTAIFTPFLGKSSSTSRTSALWSMMAASVGLLLGL
jgi:hypothetical protein